MLSLRAPQLVRAARPLTRVTVVLGGSTTVSADDSANAVVFDCRAAETFDDLSALHPRVQKHTKSAAFRKPGGRVAILRRGPGPNSTAEAAAVSEALVGFTKSLAQEIGGKGATANSLCDATPLGQDADACAGPLDWLLSSESCYITGQELRVDAKPAHTGPDEAAVLITGAARGIGHATASFYRASQPSRPLVLVDHPSAAEALSKAAAAIGGAVALPLDVTDAGAGEAIAAAGHEHNGFSAVLHAAGITRDKTFGKMTAEAHWDPVIDVNLRAVAQLDAALLSTQGALAAGGAGFVSFGSISGIAGNAGQSNYAASKSGLMGYAKAMGGAHSAHRFAVVAPGFIVTEMTQKIPFVLRTVSSKLNAFGQGGEPVDVARAVAFLASSAASGLAAGSVLRVCGNCIIGR
jgi:3-oxoacyl-[acyl-carrier protein] reductase